jgi:hypothetical protein
VVKNICLVLLLVLVCTCSSHQDYFLFEMVIGMKGNFHKILLMRWKVMNFLLFLVVGDFGFVFWWLQGEHFCNSSFLILVNFVDCVWNSFMHMMYLCLYLTLKLCSYFVVIYTILNVHDQTLADEINDFFINLLSFKQLTKYKSITFSFSPVSFLDCNLRRAPSKSFREATSVLSNYFRTKN